MKIAILAPIAWRTPPEHYGPWEQVASNITEELVANNIDVTLFATRNAVTTAKLEWCCEKPYAEDNHADAKVNECLHISYLFERAQNFDIIHNHYDFLPLSFSGLINTSIVTTIHGFSSPLIIPVYKKYNNRTHYVAISNANRHPDLDYTATVYNGINTSSFSYCNQPQEYLVYFGRIHPDKGTKEAIAIAAKAGIKLIIAGIIQDHDYFNQFIRPAIDGSKVVYVGNYNPAQRNVLLGGAIALLHPISFDEPFGLSVAEAMCCGTPVIAFNRGAMRELILHDKTGFLVDNIEDAVKAVSNVVHIERRTCRQHVMQKFSKEKMTADYIKVYEKILTDRY